MKSNLHSSPRAARPTRRQFIGQVAALGATASVLDPLRRWAIPELWAAESVKANDAVLVVLQLAGGNDGLNTLIPFDNDFYRRARPQLAIPKQDDMVLTPEFMLHPSLTGLKRLYDDGRLAAVHAVGYPKPNRSHFRSMEIWQTASDSDRFERHGWIGRYFDHALAGAGASAGVAITGQMPQAFASRGGQGIVTSDPREFRMPEGMEPDEKSGTEEHPMADDTPESVENAGATIQGLGGHIPADPPSLDMLQHIEQDALRSAREMQRVLAATSNVKPYPQSRIARDLSVAGRLIAGGMPTRIYYLSHGGYDTHVGQANAHVRLLKDLGDAVLAFMEDLQVCGQQKRVALLMFSEFGRRVAENASGGTDHGVAGPAFVCGGGVPAGLHGTFPSLAPDKLTQGDVPHTCDFRSIYATLLKRHLGTDPTTILGRAFPLLPELKKT